MFTIRSFYTFVKELLKKSFKYYLLFTFKYYF